MTDPSTPRIAEELRLVQARFPNAYLTRSPDGGEWVVVPDYPLPEAIWKRAAAAVAHRISPAHPTERPYGVFVEGPMLVQGSETPTHYAPGQVGPIPGNWGVFSFYVEPMDWKPASTAEHGSNLLQFLVGFGERLREGA